MSPSLRLATEVEIVNIHQNNVEFSLANDIYSGIDPPEGVPPHMPTMVLYNAKGLKLFEHITYLDEYYLTNTEIEILKTHARRIAEKIPEDAQLLELGSGNLRKIEILLKECERVKKHVDYFALDLSLSELQRTFSEVSTEEYEYVGLHGLHGTYDDALAWLHKAENRTRPTVILSIGSSLGNFSRPEAAGFLGAFAKIMAPSDMMVVGLDGCKDPEKVYRAYNDTEGITHQFYKNGLVHANEVLGCEAFKPSQWEIITRFDKVDGRHQAFYAPTQDVIINGVTLPKGKKLVFEEATKYGPEERDQLWRDAGLIQSTELANSSDDYHMHVLSSAAFDLPTIPSQYAAQTIPSIQDFQTLWTAWDTVTKSMVPREELLSQPIKLRNALIFYLGHIPTFDDIHLTRALRSKPTEPRAYQFIFERGIDPDVEDPEQCHTHSEIPDQWPPLGEILDYQERVRGRVKSILQREDLAHDRCLGEALWISFEHEIMHLETFLYMLLQSEKTLPPPAVDKPDFEALYNEARQAAKPNEWFPIPEQTLSIGLDDSYKNEVPEYSFGWDNEKPSRVVQVHSFEAKGHPVTNGEYAKYLQANFLRKMPASWVLVHENGNYPIPQAVNGSSGSATKDFMSNFAVRTVFGPVPLFFAQDWPLIASYDELSEYAESIGCRIPTFEEARSIYYYSSKLKENNSHQHANGHSSDANGTAIKNGINKNGPQTSDNSNMKPVQPPSTDSMPVYTDLTDCNIGFKHWHPTPVVQNGDKLAGQGEIGGVWEWTSSPLLPHDGFEAMEIYPGYTSDFFDGKHNIILGGSWATHPRVAGRTTFVNWYQRNYTYVWAGARLVRDI